MSRPKPTTVISVRGHRPAELQADPDFVYVGRAMPRIGWRASAWGNPFKPDMTADRAMAILESIPFDDMTNFEGMNSDQRIEDMTLVDIFKFYLLSRKSLRSRLPELRGKTLGCWCGSWEPGHPDIGCHAVVLATLANGLESEVAS